MIVGEVQRWLPIQSAPSDIPVLVRGTIMVSKKSVIIAAAAMKKGRVWWLHVPGSDEREGYAIRCIPSEWAHLPLDRL